MAGRISNDSTSDQSNDKSIDNITNQEHYFHNDDHDDDGGGGDDDDDACLICSYYEGLSIYFTT